MILSFSNTVSALTYSFVREHGGVPCNTIVRFVLDQHARMPDFLRLPLRCLTLVLDGEAIAISGRPFHRLPPERRWRLILRWKHSRFGACADLMRFYESLAVFGWSNVAYERRHST
jgi:hypothetical protein